MCDFGAENNRMYPRPISGYGSAESGRNRYDRNIRRMASIQQYLFLKEEEIYKITTALECIRYGLSQRETLQYLVQKQRRQGGNAS